MSSEPSATVAFVRMVLADPAAVELLRDALRDDGGTPRPLAYTVEGLAKATGVGESAIRGAIRRGELQAGRRGFGSRAPFLIAASDVETWLHARQSFRRPPTPRSGPRRASRPMAAALERLAKDVA